MISGRNVRILDGMKEFEHYICKRIRLIYRKSLLVPVIFLALLIMLYFWTDISSAVFPRPIGTADADDKAYGTVSLENLRFTGYTESVFGTVNGYYYYTIKDKACYLVLLSPQTCEQGLPYMESVSIRCRLIPLSQTQQTVLTSLSGDLGWTAQGIQQSFSPLYFNEPDYHYTVVVVLFVLIIIFGIHAIIDIITALLYIRFPHLSPMIRPLSKFGNAKVILEKAEEELMTLPQLATDDLFITEHFFIAVTDRTVAVVPIREIIWVYKHSTLHKFLWYHFSISYTLSLTARKHIYIQFPKNTKTDIDGIIDYLAEANHKILVGFSEENRLKVQAIQGTPLQLDKLFAFFKRRI